MTWQHLWPLIGIMAALFTSTSFVPQLLLRIKKPAEAKMAYETLITFMAGALLWLAYGIHLQDLIIIGANAFVLLNAMAITLLRLFQKRPGAGQTGRR